MKTQMLGITQKHIRKFQPMKTHFISTRTNFPKTFFIKKKLQNPKDTISSDLEKILWPKILIGPPTMLSLRWILPLSFRKLHLVWKLKQSSSQKINLKDSYETGA